jgi:hypothetical protein
MKAGGERDATDVAPGGDGEGDSRLTCSACSEPVSRGERFCRSCGAVVGTTGAGRGDLSPKPDVKFQTKSPPGATSPGAAFGRRRLVLVGAAAAVSVATVLAIALGGGSGAERSSVRNPPPPLGGKVSSGNAVAAGSQAGASAEDRPSAEQTVPAKYRALLGRWAGTAVQIRPSGRRDDVVVRPVRFRWSAAHGLTGRWAENDGQSTCTGRLRLKWSGSSGFTFASTNIERTSDCSPSGVVVISPSGKGRFRFEETYTTTTGDGHVSGSIKAA